MVETIVQNTVVESSRFLVEVSVTFSPEATYQDQKSSQK